MDASTPDPDPDELAAAEPLPLLPAAVPLLLPAAAPPLLPPLPPNPLAPLLGVPEPLPLLPAAVPLLLPAAVPPLLPLAPPGFPPPVPDGPVRPPEHEAAAAPKTAAKTALCSGRRRLGVMLGVGDAITRLPACALMRSSNSSSSWCSAS